MKGHVVGRSCGEALLRKVSSAGPWKLRLMNFLLDKDTLDPSVGGGRCHATALKEHSLKYCFPISIIEFQWFPWSWDYFPSWPFCCFCLSYNSLPVLNTFHVFQRLSWRYGTFLVLLFSSKIFVGCTVANTSVFEDLSYNKLKNNNAICCLMPMATNIYKYVFTQQFWDTLYRSFFPFWNWISHFLPSAWE